MPNLYEPDERELVLQNLRAHCKGERIPEAPDRAMQFFIERARDNLHIVLCMSPVGDGFRRRCRMFPSLISCCTIDWVTTWPEAALLSVARERVAKVGAASKSA